MTREEAIKIVKEFINGTCLHLVDQEALETLIPELKESEDERIRKWIINLLGSFRTKDRCTECLQKLDEAIAWLEKQKEQNPAEWSEEDERMLSRCIKSVECSKQFADSETYKAAKDVEMNWLKSLPKRFNLQPKQEWSDEDKDTIDLMIAILRENHPNELFKTNPINTTCMSAIGTDMLIKRIEALRPQPKQEWGEKETKDLVHILKVLDDCYVYGKHDLSKTDYDNLTSMIKSLRP